MTHFTIILFLLGAAAGAVFAQDRISINQINNPKIRYIAPEKLKAFPVPVIGYRAPGLASPAERNQVLQDVVYPVINSSDEAIAAVVIEFYRERQDIGLSVYWHNGRFASMLVERDKNGRIGKDVYRQVIEVPEHDDK